jgi:hypothetical protein
VGRSLLEGPARKTDETRPRQKSGRRALSRDYTVSRSRSSLPIYRSTFEDLQPPAVIIASFRIGLLSEVQQGPPRPYSVQTSTESSRNLNFPRRQPKAMYTIPHISAFRKITLTPHRKTRFRPRASCSEFQLFRIAFKALAVSISERHS